MAENLASPSPAAVSARPTKPIVVRKLRVAYQKRNVTYAQLHHVSVCSSSSSETIMRQFRDLVFTSMVPIFSRLLKNIEIEIADVKLIQPTFPQCATTFPSYVTVHNPAPSPLLTHAFRRPGLLQTETPNNLDLDLDALSTATDRDLELGSKALVVRTKANRTSVAIVLVAIFTLACMVGVTVGIAAKRADIGLGVATAVFGFLAVVPGVLVFF